jgi:hypothetical protein
VDEGPGSAPLLRIRTQLSAGGPGRLALLPGILAGELIDAESADLWVTDSDGRRIEITWPAGFHARSNPIRLVNPQGQDVAKAGEEIFLAGGNLAGTSHFSSHTVSVDSPLRQRRC